MATTINTPVSRPAAPAARPVAAASAKPVVEQKAVDIGDKLQTSAKAAPQSAEAKGLKAPMAGVGALVSGYVGSKLGQVVIGAFKATPATRVIGAVGGAVAAAAIGGLAMARSVEFIGGKQSAMKPKSAAETVGGVVVGGGTAAAMGLVCLKAATLTGSIGAPLAIGSFIISMMGWAGGLEAGRLVKKAFSKD